MQRREDIRDGMWMIGALFLFGSALLLALSWIGVLLAPVLLWTLGIGAMLFVSAWAWGQLAPTRTVEITSHEREEHRAEEQVEEEMRRAA